ncbi:MAG: hypothetical protein RXN92_02045 [Thermoplasmatales archaeon]
MDLHFYPSIELEAMLYGICRGSLTKDIQCVPDYECKGDIYLGPVGVVKLADREIIDSGNIFSNFMGPNYYYEKEEDYVNIKKGDMVSKFYAKLLLNRETREGLNLPLVLSPYDEFINRSTGEVFATFKIDLFSKWADRFGEIPMPLYLATLKNNMFINSDLVEEYIRKSIKFLHYNLDSILRDIIDNSKVIEELNLHKLSIFNFINRSSFSLKLEDRISIETIAKYL